MNQIAKTEVYRNVCRHHLKEGQLYNRHLYYEHLPVHLVNGNYKVTLDIKRIHWNDDAMFEKGVFEAGHKFAGNPFETYKESCRVLIIATVETSIYFPIEIETDLYFEVIGHMKGSEIAYYPLAHNSYSRDMEHFHDMLNRTQKRFKLTGIANILFDGKIIFGFYTDIIRKIRNSQPANIQLQNISYLEQLEQAHNEVATHITHALMYVPFVDDLLGRKINHQGNILYAPNVNYYSYQFYIACESAIERLYTFWETLIVLPYNYERLGLSGQTPSFGKYFRKLIELFQKKLPVLFSEQSPNLKWLLDFFTGDYSEITHYRHRFVHHEFTASHEGLLSAKYSLNAWKHIDKKIELQKLNEEIKALPSLLIKHFNYCIEGFKHMVYLVDELP